MSISGHPELDAAVAEYIAARKEAQSEYDRLCADDPKAAYEARLRIESEAWEEFFPIKIKYWNIDHPEEQYARTG